jgi:hypothetical protein
LALWRILGRLLRGSRRHIQPRGCGNRVRRAGLLGRWWRRVHCLDRRCALRTNRGIFGHGSPTLEAKHSHLTRLPPVVDLVFLGLGSRKSTSFKLKRQSFRDSRNHFRNATVRC